MTIYTLNLLNSKQEHTLVLKHVGAVSFNYRQYPSDAYTGYSIEIAISVYANYGKLVYRLLDTMEVDKKYTIKEIENTNFFDYYYNQYKDLKNILAIIDN
jgi:hypothetical protein